MKENNSILKAVNKFFENLGKVDVNPTVVPLPLDDDPRPKYHVDGALECPACAWEERHLDKPLIMPVLGINGEIRNNEQSEYDTSSIDSIKQLLQQFGHTGEADCPECDRIEAERDVRKPDPELEALLDEEERIAIAHAAKQRVLDLLRIGPRPDAAQELHDIHDAFVDAVTLDDLETVQGIVDRQTLKWGPPPTPFKEALEGIGVTFDSLEEQVPDHGSLGDLISQMLGSPLTLGISGDYLEDQPQYQEFGTEPEDLHDAGPRSIKVEFTPEEWTDVVKAAGKTNYDDPLEFVNNTILERTDDVNNGYVGAYVFNQKVSDKMDAGAAKAGLTFTEFIDFCVREGTKVAGINNSVDLLRLIIAEDKIIDAAIAHHELMIVDPAAARERLHSGDEEFKEECFNTLEDLKVAIGTYKALRDQAR